MKIIKTAKRLASLLILMGAGLSVSGCGNLASPLDNAIYSGGDQFGMKGYSRTIFSTSNF
jgi:hypothetical protein